MEDLKVRLQQAKKDKQVQMDVADLEIRDIENQIADGDVTYSIGDRFKRISNHNDKWILALDGHMGVTFVNLSNGSCANGSWANGSNRVASNTMITADEFSRISFGNITRYWDNRKQCKV